MTPACLTVCRSLPRLHLAVYLRGEREVSQRVPEVSRQRELFQFRLELGTVCWVPPRSRLPRSAALDHHLAFGDHGVTGDNLHHSDAPEPHLSRNNHQAYPAQARIDGASSNHPGVLQRQLRGVSDVRL